MYLAIFVVDAIRRVRGRGHVWARAEEGKGWVTKKNEVNRLVIIDAHLDVFRAFTCFNYGLRLRATSQITGTVFSL